MHRTLAVVVLAGAAWLVYNYLANAPQRARAELALGVKKLSPGAYEEAMAHFNRAIQIWPDFGEAYLNRAVAEHDESQPGPALADLNRALDLDPDSTRAYNERGQIYLENGDLRKAIAEFSRSLQVTPTVEGHYQRGEAYEKLGDHQKAIADFDAAIVESARPPTPFARAPQPSGPTAIAPAPQPTKRRRDGSRQDKHPTPMYYLRLDVEPAHQDALIADLWEAGTLGVVEGDGFVEAIR